MIKNNLVINLLRLEVVKKGQTATFAFLGFSIISFIYGYGSVRFLPLIKSLSVLLFVISIIPKEIPLV